MAAVGIPAYRLPRDILNREISIIKSAGVEIRHNMRLGKDITLRGLRELGYRATFLAFGCHNSGLMGVEGENANYAGFIPGVVFLRDLNLGHPIKPQKSVAIVGGGNVAMDCARTALRLGFSDVNLIYRRTRAEMPANIEEIEDAEKEGIKFHFLTNPTRIMADNGKVTGLELQRMELGEPDSSGRRRPKPVAGSEFVMKVDVVIPAIGQVTDLSCLCATDAVGATHRGNIEVNPSTLATGEEGVFAGGECVTGPASLVEALAAGNRGAIVIDHYLRGEPLAHSDEENVEEIFSRLGAYSPSEDIETAGRREPSFLPHQPVERMDPDTDVKKPNCRRRPHQVVRPAEVRIWDFDEVELGFAPQTAVTEAERCLRCYRIGLVSTLNH
jgi:formate dehydrogenase beta subunit